MKYLRVGNSGLQVSQIGLGCMSFGDPDRGRPEWSVRAEDAEPLIKDALDAGVTFFDTANVYSDGSSEEILGTALKKLKPRDDVVIATKVWGRMRPGPYGSGLSRKAILAEAEASLRRLGTEFIDLYQIHRLDPLVPMEETLQALDDLVRSGKVRYIGASSMRAWEFARVLYLCRAHGWTVPIAMQNRYNLLYREEEREMASLCSAEGIGMLPWSPLARGRLARDGAIATTLNEPSTAADALYEQVDRQIVSEADAIAAEREVSRATVALAWLLSRPGVDAPILGISKQGQLDAALQSTDFVLSAEEIARLERPYVPRPVSEYR